MDNEKTRKLLQKFYSSFQTFSKSYVGNTDELIDKWIEENLQDMKKLQEIKNKVDFISSAIAYDFTERMGQYALEIRYTNGTKDMLTTKVPEDMGHDRGDFESEKEFFDTVSFLKSENLLVKQ